MKRKMKLQHSGEILKIEVIEGRKLTIGKTATLLGITRKSNISTLHRIKVQLNY